MDPLSLILYFAFVIPSAIFHEYAHGFAADLLGDPTPRRAGRLTLNPLPHIDPIGTLLLPVLLMISSNGALMFAYAKPVPFNPYNLKYPKWGPAIVGGAGPFANFLLAVVFAFLARLIGGNLAVILSTLVYVNIALMMFNLLPVPPLDGSKLLFALLPPSMHNVQIWLEKYGIILFVLLLLGVGSVITPLVNGLYNFLI